VEVNGPGTRQDAPRGQPPAWLTESASYWQSRLMNGPRGSGPLRRQPEGRLAGGVAAGLADRTGLNVTAIRIAFVIASLISGFGVTAYVLGWLFLPAAGQDTTIASTAKSDRRGIALAAMVASLLLLLLLISSALGVGWISSLSWPPILAAAGLVLIWRNAPADEQELLRALLGPLVGDTSAGGRPRTGLRLSLAAGFLVVGLALLVPGTKHINVALLRPLGGVILVTTGIVVLLGPWWLRILRDLMTERQARIRAEERAEMASRVHDSVLQTLALIQRRADDPQQVIRLARAQERELRSWLFDGRPPGSLDGLAATVAGGVRLIQQEVEAQHGIVVEVITVGDCPLNDDLGALLAAAREATVNAAKWSGAHVVSLFAEVEPATVSVYVKDRGKGFDPETVPADRKGLAESIKARMVRRGGQATIKTAPGEGTEVSLSMAR
jgi:signal transduction histidine kinase